MRVDEEFVDVLYGVESSIVAAFQDHPKADDRDVQAAITSLVKGYEREKMNRRGFAPRPSGVAGHIYDRCRQTCEWYLGRDPVDNEHSGSNKEQTSDNLSLVDLLRCLKRLRKSVRLWHAQGGRRGYLSYVQEFIAEGNRELGI